MSNVTIAALRAPSSPGAMPVAGGPANAPTLLVPPSPSSNIDVDDAVNKLLEMSSQMSEQQMLLGKSQADVADGQRKAAAAQRKEALDRAIEAAKKAREAQDDGGFFSFVTDNIGLTGLVGLATFNWGLVAADITAHQTGLAKGGTDLLDLGTALCGGPLMYLAAQGAKDLAPEAMSSTALTATLLGGPMGYALERAAREMTPDDFEKSLAEITTIKDDDLRVANKVALMVALAAVAAVSTVLTAGTTAPAIVSLVGIGVSTATQVAADTGALKEVFGEKAAAYIAIGGAIAGAALTLGGSIGSLATSVNTVNDAMSRTLTAVNAAKSVTEGVAMTMSGVQALERAEHQHDADLANVSAEEARNVLKRLEKVIDGILEDLQEAKESAQRATETLQATLQTNNQTMLQAGAMKV
ncbi:MAG TPA: hypothetical protein VM925_34520 [Labilithrix sp.]|nr:hypothetical protein [Labilithrix sp.]